jgi:hypothetical protein
MHVSTSHVDTYIHIPFPNGQPYYNIFFGFCQELFCISHGKYFIPAIPFGNSLFHFGITIPRGIACSQREQTYPKGIDMPIGNSKSPHTCKDMWADNINSVNNISEANNILSYQSIPVAT